MKGSKERDKEEARDALKRVLSPGDTVYGIVRTVSRSGLSRTIDFYAIQQNQPIYLSGYMSTLLGISRNKEGALKVSGCGMDMIFATVSDLSRTLFEHGYALKHEGL
jgi:hypothetical protein